MQDRRRDVALFRYSLIREAADPALSKAERGALVRALADADDGLEAVAERVIGLGANLLVGFALIGAAFAVADDDQPRSRLLEHRRRNVTGMRAVFLRMEVLRADRDPVRPGDGGRDQGEGRADRDVDPGRFSGGDCDRRQFGKLGEVAVHLPVAGDQLAVHSVSSSFPEGA